MSHRLLCCVVVLYQICETEWSAPPSLAVGGAVLYIFFDHDVVRFRKSLAPSVNLMLQWQQSLIIDEPVYSSVSADMFRGSLLCFDS